ncbi:MAG: ABC transporter ATP-binding protein/permease [bacterium]|nr:ABC transporter ATP-binding protein/permease [bacterium]
MKRKRGKKKDVTVKDVLAVFWHYMRPNRWSIFAIFAFIFLHEIVQVIVPLYYKRLIDAIATLPQFDESSFHVLVAILVSIVLLRILGTAFIQISNFIAGIIQPKIRIELLRSTHRVLLQQSYRFVTNSFSGALVQKAQRFSRSFGTIAESARWNIFPAIVSITAILIVLSQRSSIFVLVVITWVFLYIVFNLIYSRWAVQFQEKRATKESETSGFLNDSVSNTMNVKLFTNLTQEEGGFRKISGELQRLITRTWNLENIRWLIEMVINIAVEFIVLYYAFQFWSKGAITVGDVVLIQSYLFSLFWVIGGIAHVIRNSFESVADAKEMVEIMHSKLEIRDARGAKELRVTRGKIEFKNVYFDYGKERRILDGLSLTIASTEKVALIGPSGTGKSTIVKLLLRFFDVSKGHIRIDGQDITKVAQDSLRGQIAFVPQDSILFHRTIMENIRYGRSDATDDEVFEASKKAHCHEFISELPEGYGAKVGERGVKLSGGERQRVAIARAILKNAPILVLDEATSSLDSESESYIQDALGELMKDKTVIVIAHRLSTIMKMDRIIVMEKGKIVDTGTHGQLLKKVGVYRKLWEIQAGGFKE